MSDEDKYNFPLMKGEINEDGDYVFEIPIEWFDGYEVTDKETGEFLGWVDAKNKRIVKYEVTEIIHEENEKNDK